MILSLIDYSNPALLRLRHILGRRLGLLRPLSRLVRRVSDSGYEEAFDAALLASVRPGDTIWDVGANEAHYTRKLAEAADRGQVIAFEPSPRTFAALAEKFEGAPNVRLENVALSSESGEQSFFLSPNATLDSLFARSPTASVVTVRTVTGDSYAGRFSPDIVKIDVEGFEWEVLKGMTNILNSRRLRRVFVEVHFSILCERGMQAAPRTIVRQLQAAGFRVRWLDPSHLVGSRS